MPFPDDLPNPLPPLKHPPLMDLSFAALGWLYRAAGAVGSARFVETLNRAEFYLDRAQQHCDTPADAAVIEGLFASIDALITANAQARTLLAHSVSGMGAAEATEFEELCDAADEPPALNG